MIQAAQANTGFGWFEFALLAPHTLDVVGGGRVLAHDSGTAFQYALNTLAGCCDVVILDRECEALAA